MAARNNPKFGKISDFLASSKALSRVHNHIEKIRALQIKLCEQLEAPINQHITVANCRQEMLTLHTDSPAWAAKLRFRTPDILAIINNKCHMTDIQTIRIKVMPVSLTNTNTRSATKMSSHTANFIREVADNISDVALRSSLYNISKNAG